MTVFYAEDDHEDQLIFTAALRELQPGVQLFFAENGAEAVKVLTGLPDAPEIIFLDINMPVMNGTDCVSVLKNLERFRETPVILYSTTSNPIEVEKGLAAGANAFLVKANTYQEVVNDMNKILNKFVA